MLSVPGGKFLFETYGKEWRPPPDRGKLAGQRGVGVQFPWQKSPTISHSHMLTVASLWVSKYPVTNQQYARFLNDSGYKPADLEHWLEHWEGVGAPSTAQLQRPVTYVSLSDAKAFCKYYGARLPHTWEWQWFASNGSVYPWGNLAPTNDTCPSIGGGIGENLTAVPPADVDAHPAGCSPETGLCDLVGNAWEMTDAFVDQHNRAVVLKGGSRYHASGSMWYFPNALAVNTHEKAFLFSDGYERGGTVGFRCVADSSVPIFDPCAKCEKTMCLCIDGRVTPEKASGGVDLSGAQNWLSTVVAKRTVIAHKAMPAPSSTLSLSFINASDGSSIRPYCCSPVGIRWTDGAMPYSSVSNSQNGIDMASVGSGFALQVAATSQPRRLTIFAGCWSATCRLRATLDDEETIVREVTVGKVVLMYQWEIVVRSANDVGMLTLQWVVIEGDGNVTFQAAMLNL